MTSFCFYPPISALESLILLALADKNDKTPDLIRPKEALRLFR